MGLENSIPRGLQENRSSNVFDAVLQKFDLAGRLGLTDDTDKALLSAYFIARIVRNPQTKRAELLNDPRIASIRNLPILGNMIKSLEASEERHKKNVEEIEQMLREIVEVRYSSPEDRVRARTIEMAANALIANALNQGYLTEGSRRTLLFNEEDLEQWAEFWKPKITTSQTVDRI